MLNTVTENRMSKKKPQNPHIKEFSKFLKISGYAGGIDKFAEQFLSSNKYNVYYQLREYGEFDESQKQLIIQEMMEGKNRKYGIKDAALPLLEKILGMKIPRGGDIKAKGDNIAINNSSVSVNQGPGKDLEKALKAAQDELEEKNKQILKLETMIEAYKEMLHGSKEGDK